MKLLLDTHIALWAVTTPERLPARAQDLLLDPVHEKWASVVNIWEAAIKHTRRQHMARDAVSSGTKVRLLLDEAGFDILPVLPAHATEVDHLPDYHRDPFDRLLIAQARTEPMYLLTHDTALAAYGDHVLVV